MQARASATPKSRMPLKDDWLRSGESQAATPARSGQIFCVPMRGMQVSRGSTPKMTALRRIRTPDADYVFCYFGIGRERDSLTAMNTVLYVMAYSSRVATLHCVGL